MIRCYITDRASLQGETLLQAIARNLRDGVEWIQLREKDLSGRDLHELTRAALALPNPNGTKILVNSRVDIALAAGAHGAHLPDGSPDASRWRSIVPQGFLVGISCHSIESVKAASDAGADYILYAPVFAPLSKVSAIPPHGLEGLAEAARTSTIPVLALGGITRENTSQCVEAGAAGIAAVSLFQKQPKLYQHAGPSC